MLNDLKFSLRHMLKNPGFTLVAVLTLGLGIGANTAIFSVANGLLFRPLPYANGGQLVRAWENVPAPGQEDLGGTSLPALEDWRRESQAFENVAGYFFFLFNLSGEGNSEAVQGSFVTATLFPLLGVSPALGRTFTAEEDKPGAGRVVIISDSLWRRRFQADPGIIGRAMSVDAQPCTIVGVMPRGFNFPPAPPRGMSLPTRLYELYLPASASPVPVARAARAYNVIARLRPGMDAPRAQAELQTLTERLEQRHSDAPRGVTPRVEPLRAYLFGEMRTALTLLFGAVAAVLLIACANVAGLLLARGMARQSELAIRAALGASHGRLVRQLFSETLLLAVIGGAFGLLLAAVLIKLLIRLGPGETLRLMPIPLDWSVLAFTAVLSLLASLGAGLVPAWKATHTDPARALNERAATGGIGRRRWRDALVVFEMAVALVLLTGAGLMIRSVARLQAVPPGFQDDHVLTGFFTLPFARYSSPPQTLRFYEATLERIRNLPGVESVALVNALPLSGLSIGGTFRVEGLPDPEAGRLLHQRVASADYFATMRIALRRGRGFALEDGTNGLPVALVNETLALRHFGSIDPVGRRIALGRNGAWRTIVGVVADVRHGALDAEPHPEVWLPLRQQPWSYMNLVVRTAGDPMSFATLVRRAVAAVDADQPVHNLRPMRDFVAQSSATRRFNMQLLAAFAFLALTLAIVGLHGVMTFLVTQRTREIGVRLALGARPADVRRMILREGGWRVLAGCAVGVAGALALARLIQGHLFGVTATDPLTLVAVSLLLMGVAGAACWQAANRASRVNPMEALRGD